MIDIHVHLLPGVDDGPASWEESIDLAGQMAEEGIRGAVCTSHVIERLDEAIELIYRDKFNILREKIRSEGIDLQLWLASELYCYAQIDTRSFLATLNNNRKYLLFEFPMGEIPKDAGELIFQWTLDGLIPILAHPERNRRISSDPGLIPLLIERGVMMQMDAGSLLGEFGRHAKKTAQLMAEHRLVHFVASDYHHPKDGGTGSLRRAYDMIAQKWDASFAERLFHGFPASAVAGKEIVPPNPIPLKRKITAQTQSLFEGR